MEATVESHERADSSGEWPVVRSRATLPEARRCSPDGASNENRGTEGGVGRGAESRRRAGSNSKARPERVRTAGGDEEVGVTGGV